MLVDGEVVTGSGVAPGDRRDEDEIAHDQARAEKLTGQVEDAVGAATEADRVANTALKELLPSAAGLEREVTGSDNTVAAGDIPGDDASPKQVNKWWNNLTPLQQESAIYSHGDKIGSLDGIPVAARDRANRTGFAEDQSRVKTRIAELDEKKHLQPPEQEEYDTLKGKLKGMKAIDDRLNRDDDYKGPESYLMNFSPKGNGRAIVATGNPDRAHNVVTAVPGMDAGLEGMDTHLNRSEQILQKASRAYPDEEVASVTWLGYEAPQGVPAAASDGYAEDAAGDLQQFQDGLRATHEGGTSTNTLIGHSYGSTVVGEAAQYGDAELEADNVVLLGSPGVNADGVSELQLPDDADVYASTAENDIINGVYGIDFALNARGFPDIHGTPPIADSFGAHTFPSDPGPEGDIPGLGSKEAHSAYWNRNSKSLDAMASIVVGKEPQ